MSVARIPAATRALSNFTIKKPLRAPMPNNAMSRRTPTISRSQLLAWMRCLKPISSFEGGLTPVNPREIVRGNELFLTKQQNLIYIDVIKSKHHIYVPMQWIDMNHLRRIGNTLVRL